MTVDQVIFYPFIFVGFALEIIFAASFITMAYRAYQEIKEEKRGEGFDHKCLYLCKHTPRIASSPDPRVEKALYQKNQVINKLGSPNRRGKKEYSDDVIYLSEHFIKFNADGEWIPVLWKGGDDYIYLNLNTPAMAHLESLYGNL